MPQLSGSTTPKHRVGGDGRIHGRTAARQHLRSRLRCQRLAGGHDPAVGNHHRARRGTVLRVRGNRQKEKECGEEKPWHEKESYQGGGLSLESGVDG